tara:strand:- start:679 stop:867 length:189 start_codon:yes stop_codon:yes gene_type:complete
MKDLIAKYFLNEGSTLVKKGRINSKEECNAWFKDSNGNIQHRCVEEIDLKNITIEPYIPRFK